MDATPPNEDSSASMHTLDILILLAKHKRILVSAVLGAAILAAIVSLVLPQSYKSSTRIMPPQQSQSLAALLIGQLGQAAGGLNPASLGLKNPSDMYVSILRGRTISDAIIQRFKLKELYNAETDVDAREGLQDRVSVFASRDGIINVEVEDRDPTRAADIANAFIQELESLTLNIAVTDAGQRRLFFEKQVRSARDDLTKAEVALRTFLEESGLAVPGEQAQLTVSAAAHLRAEMTAKEVQLASMRSFAADQNPDLLRTQRELASLKKELERIGSDKGERGDVLVAIRGVPGASHAYLQHLRDVKYQEALFELLSKQYELAKVEEAKNATVIQVIDRGIPSDKRSWPHRTLIVLLTATAAGLLALLWLMLRETLDHWRIDPESAKKLNTLEDSFRPRARPPKSEG